jgi:hypothetical protein
MPTDSYKLGPGTLTLGTDPDENEFAMQLTNCRVDPTENVNAGDDLNLLDGSTLDGEDDVTYDYTVAGTAVQDLATDGFTDYCWQNRGLNVAFEFVPVTARAATVTGTCRIRPITIGGDVKVRNTADFEFAVIGDPEFTPDATP